MDQDALMETAVNILENGDPIPGKVSNRLVAAMIKRNHHQTCLNKEKSEDNEKKIIRLEALMGVGTVVAGILATLTYLGII